MGEIHRYDPNLHIRCGIQGCPQTYKKFESFRSHVYRKHRESLHFTEQSNHQNVSNPPQSSNQDSQDLDPDSSADTATTNDHLSAAALSDITGRFILKLREEYRIPQSTTNKVIEDINGLFVTVLDLLRERDSSGQPFNGETDLNLFRGLQNEYQQLRYYEDHFNYLVSSCIGYIHP